MKLHDIISCIEFRTISALFHAPMASGSWQQKHPAATLEVRSAIRRIRGVDSAIYANQKSEIVSAFLTVLIEVRESDASLKYSEEVFRWWIETLDGDNAVVALAVLLATASAPQRWLTSEEAAVLTRTDGSTWRKNAADGTILAIKRGKTWLIHESEVIRRGGSMTESVDAEAD